MTNSANRDATTCPLCQRDNECELARTRRADAPCWCLEITIPPDVKRDAAMLGAACVCRQCAQGNKPSP